VSGQSRETVREGSAPHTVPDGGGLIGRVLGGFVILEKLGEGGFGAVYRAEQRVLAREAVIKIMRDAHQASPEMIERFRREAHLASLLEHPYTAHVYAFGDEPDGLLWIAMELVRGTPLDRLLKAQGPLPLDRFVPLLDKICEVVHTAHEHGIVHRDIKPANVMVISRAGRLLPKLLDFGLAKGLHRQPATGTAGGNEAGPRPVDQHAPATEPEATAATAIVQVLARGGDIERSVFTRGVLGTPSYMAPEQWRDTGSVDLRADIYALGVLTFRSLTGRAPFTGTAEELMLAHLTEPVPPLGAAFPVALDAVLGRAMAKEPADRFPTALELAAAVRDAAGYHEQGTPLPRLEEELRDELLMGSPAPIAEAVASLGAARNAHQARDRTVEAFRVCARYLGLVGLACVSSLVTDGTEPWREDLRRLCESGSTDEEWVGLARSICRPFAAQREVFPMPELVELFFPDDASRTAELDRALGELVELQAAARRGAGADENRVLELLERGVPALSTLLRRLAFLRHYLLMVPRHDVVERWMGVTRYARYVEHWRDVLEVGKPALVDGDGRPVAMLWPLIQVAQPAPGASDAMFFLDGRGDRGARMLAMPRGFEREDADCWTWIEGKLRGVSAPSSRTPGERAPYPGLVTFSADDAPVFFGREREAEAARNRLRIQPLLVVVGPSGAGKSSFVHAGVVPGLPQGSRALTLRPGRSPLSALAAIVAPYVGADERSLRAAMERAPEALGAALRGAAGAQGGSVALVIDQFEEAFTLCTDDDERLCFSAALVQAARAVDDPVRVILTLRDDFLVRAEGLPALRERLAPAIQLIVPPDEDNLLRMLTEPARLVGYQFDDRKLPREIVAAVAGRAGALPLVAFTAAKLWEHRDVRFKQLRRQAYDALGGVVGALARHAEDTLSRMTREEHRLVRETFRRLVTSEGTRAVLGRAELLQVLGANAAAEALLEKVIAARLLHATDGGEEGGERIEVVHEALLSAWPRLVTWRREDADGARLRDQLAAAARQWTERGRPRGLLWRDEALVEYRIWRARYPGNLTDTEEAFATSSLRESQRALRRQRLLVGGALATLVVMLLTVTYMQRATRRQLLATYEEKGREELLAGKPDRAAVYLSRAYAGKTDDASLRFLLGTALEQLDHAEEHGFEAHRARIASAIYRPDGRRLLTASADGSAVLWDPETGVPARVLVGAGGALHFASFRPDGLQVITAGADGSARIWDAATGEAKGRLEAHPGGVLSAVFDPRGVLALTGGMDGTARLWDAASGREIRTFTGHASAVHSAAFSPDGARVATASADGTAMLFDTATGQNLGTLRGHRDGVNTVAFSPDGTEVVTGSSDHTARIFSTADGHLVSALEEHGAAVTSASFSPDGRRVVTASADRSVAVWDAVSGRLLAIRKGDSIVTWATFSPDGARVASTDLAQRVRIWEAPLETRSPAAIEDLLKEKVHLHLEGDRLVSTVPPARAAEPVVRAETRSPVAASSATPRTFAFATERLDRAGASVGVTAGEARGYAEDLGPGVALEMVRVPGGRFQMGSPEGEGEREEHPRHAVAVGSFYIGRYEVTQRQWSAVMMSNPSAHVGLDLPVELVSWHEAMEFCERVSRQSGRVYRLPTEAEWEYACRSGSDGAYSFGDVVTPRLVNDAGHDPIARAGRSYRETTTKVGSLGVANAFGLYDMHGNVFEWCLDPWHESYEQAPDDGRVWLHGDPTYRVLRGGGWRWVDYYSRSAYRRRFPPTSGANDLGFRVVSDGPVPAATR
jgi:formylglycine-generating enzyme required for sulfatase activity/WD40 repeat protein/serine/threonine protein kinase